MRSRGRAGSQTSSGCLREFAGSVRIRCACLANARHRAAHSPDGKDQSRQQRTGGGEAKRCSTFTCSGTSRTSFPTAPFSSGADRETPIAFARSCSEHKELLHNYRCERCSVFNVTGGRDLSSISHATDSQLLTRKSRILTYRNRYTSTIARFNLKLSIVQPCQCF